MTMPTPPAEAPGDIGPMRVDGKWAGFVPPNQSTAVEAVGRVKRAPAYDVYELVTVQLLPGGLSAIAGVDREVRCWLLIAENVSAPTRHKAIAIATAGFDDERKYGTFAAPLVGDFVPKTRTRTLEPVETWS